MLTFVLVLILSGEPLVFSFVDAHPSREACEKLKAEAVKKADAEDKESFRCVKMWLGDEPV